jgi:hypothetical protein
MKQEGPGYTNWIADDAGDICSNYRGDIARCSVEVWHHDFPLSASQVVMLMNYAFKQGRIEQRELLRDALGIKRDAGSNEL